MQERQGTFITRERSTSEKIRDYIFAAVSVGSIVLIWDYRQEIVRLDAKFDAAMAYDAATQNKLSNLQGQCPAIAMDVDRVVYEMKQAAKREMEKRGLVNLDEQKQKGDL